MSIHFGFDHRKTTQGLNFFAIKSGNRINKMKAIKLIYFADRYHLRKYGRPITNGEYFAMDYGPVNSGAKDIAEMSEFLGPREKRYAKKFIKPQGQYRFSSIKDYDTAVLSETDLEALFFTWEKFGHYDGYRLKDITHEYPEWKKHEQALQYRSRVHMDYKDFLEDPPKNLEKCYPLTTEDRQDRLAQIDELTEIEALWS